MNFIDAHKIFYEFIDVISGGNLVVSKLPCNGNMEMISNASILVVGHFQYYHLGTQEQYDAICTSAESLILFEEDEVVNKKTELEKYIKDNSKWPLIILKKKEIQTAEDFLGELTFRSFDRQAHLREKYVTKFREILMDLDRMIIKEGWNRNNINDSFAVASYLYDRSGIEHNEFDVGSFFTLKTMQKIFNDYRNGGIFYYDTQMDEKLKQHLFDNCSYILRHQV